MWYFISGKSMSLLVFVVLVKSLQNFIDLSLFESSIGWFLMEHVFEEYSLTAGKFFLINGDFRTLIKNFIVIIRNIIILPQIFILLEFFVINILVIWGGLFYKKTPFNNAIKIFLFISYFFLLQYFLFFNYFLIYLFFKNFLLISLILITAMLYLFIFYWFLILKKTKLKLLIQIILTKICTYFLITCLNLICFLFAFSFGIETQENIVHELGLSTIIPYAYVYYTKFFI